MKRKRRTFDLPDGADIGPAADPAAARGSRRRGPMETAIAEVAEAGRERNRIAQAIREENDGLAHRFVALRKAGHVIELIPLDAVHETLLERERAGGEDDGLDELVTSIRDVGLSNPIRVLERPDGNGFELIQGHRRLASYRRLLLETGRDEWARVPATVMPGGSDDVAGLYRRMVDENVIRRDLSFAEMARAAMNYAADPATDAGDAETAVTELFRSASYSKRSRIRTFVSLLDTVGDVLLHPAAIPRNMGVSLAAEIRKRPGLAAEIREALERTVGRDPGEELAILRRFVPGPGGDGGSEAGRDPGDAGEPARCAGRAGQGGRTKTTFHIASAAGQLKVTAVAGRLEVRADRDFSSVERARLERAIVSLVEGLG